MNSSPSPPTRAKNPAMTRPPTMLAGLADWRPQSPPNKQERIRPSQGLREKLARWNKANDAKPAEVKISQPQSIHLPTIIHDSDDTILTYLSSSFEVPQQPIASPISSNDSGPNDFTSEMEKYFTKPHESNNEGERKALAMAVAESTHSSIAPSIKQKKKIVSEPSDSFPSMASWQTIPIPPKPSSSVCYPPRPFLSQCIVHPDGHIEFPPTASLRSPSNAIPGKDSSLAPSDETVIRKIDRASTPAYLRHAKAMAPKQAEPAMLPRTQSILDQIQDLQTQVENHKSELDTLKHENESLREQLEESLGEEEAWKEMYTAMEKEKEAAHNEILKLREQLKRSHSKQDALKARNAALEATNSTLEDKYRALKDERNLMGEALMYEWGKQEVGPRKKADGTWGMGYRYKYVKRGGKES